MKIQDVHNVELCNVGNEQISINVRADIENGSLTVSGQDLGSFCEEFWGDSDYEYFYIFSAEDTEKLLTAIGGNKNPAEALTERFSGTDGCQKLREFCKKEDICYKFSSYV